MAFMLAETQMTSPPLPTTSQWGDASVDFLADINDHISLSPSMMQSKKVSKLFLYLVVCSH